MALSTKEHNALDILEIRTVKEFLELDLRLVLDLQGYGIGTYESLKRSRTALKKRVFGQTQSDEEPKTSLQSDVEELDLNTRGRTALKRLGVKTVAEFLQLDLANFGRVRGCGEITRKHLIRAQKKARRVLPLGEASELEQASATRAPNCHEAARRPAVEGSWMTLPLFSGVSANGLCLADLHESYRPGFSVEHLGFPKRSRRALAAKNITSLGELLLTPGPELIGPKKLGPETLAKTQSIVTDFLRYSLDSCSGFRLDTSSLESFLFSLVDPVVKHERQKRVLLERMGWRSEPRTLEELASEYGVTRERIRQLEKAGLRKLFNWRASHALQPLHEFIAKLLQTASPLISLRTVGKRLQRRHGWDRPVHEEAIVKLLPAFNDLRCVESRYVCRTSLRCPDCPVLPKAVEAALLEDPPKKLDMLVLAQMVLRQMCVSGECAQCFERPAKPSVNLVRVAFRRSASLRTKYRLVKHEVWHIDECRLARGHLAGALELVLRQNPQPMTYRQVQTELNRVRQDQVAAEVVWHALNSCVAKGTKILLWDRGGVYLHKSHVNLYLPILNTIEKWVIKELEEGVVPQLSAHAAFQAFSEGCIASEIPSEYAVHSCLKHRQHPKLAFFHSPYIGLAGVSRHRIPNVEIAEDLIRQEGDVVPLDRLREVLCVRMGMKDFQFQQIISQLENVICTQYGFLHADYFDSEGHAFRELVEHVKQKLAWEAHLSVELVYAGRRISCLQLGIDGPRMLHSVLSLFAADTITVRSYPLLERPSSDEAMTRSTIRDKVAEFIRDKGRPVSCEELRKRFVSKLGFGNSTVMAVASTDLVVRYLNGIVVHRDTIEWSPDKQDALVRKAETYYTRQVLAGGLFARADLLLELHETELPPLGSGVAWTPVLLADLLERDSKIAVFGNRQNAFIVHTDGDRIRTFGGFVRLVVDKRFRGACGLAELSEFLRDSGVIAKAVTPKMLEGAGDLVVGRHEVAVK